MANKLAAATIEVSLCEPAFALVEVNKQSPDFSGFHRYQRLWVIRRDAPAEYLEDLGPVDRFAAEPFRLIGYAGGDGYLEALETVGSLRDLAEWMRNESNTLIDPELIQRRDLIGEYWNEMEQRPLRRRAVSQFGPLYKVQRI